MKMKNYDVYKAGSTKVGSVQATCISKAAQRFINTLERPAAGTYSLDSRQQAAIRYGTSGVMSDFVVMEVAR